MPSPQSTRPNYAIDGVDNALRLIQILRDEGALRVTSAARTLGVANSTAHRLLSMLVYRGFAVRDAHVYRAGPAIDVAAAHPESIRQLRLCVQSTMELLSSQLNTTVTLMVRVGLNVRMLATIESAGVFMIGDRRGEILPASKAACGKALLAHTRHDVLERLYRSEGAHLAGTYMPDGRFASFVTELDVVRQRGYARNLAETEPGIAAFAMPVSDAAGRAVAAFSVVLPSAPTPGAPTRAAAVQLMTIAQDSMNHAVAGIDFI